MVVAPIYLGTWLTEALQSMDVAGNEGFFFRVAPTLKLPFSLNAVGIRGRFQVPSATGE